MLSRNNWTFVWLLVIFMVFIPFAAFSGSSPGDLNEDPQALLGEFKEGVPEEFTFFSSTTTPAFILSESGGDFLFDGNDTAIVRTILSDGSMPLKATFGNSLTPDHQSIIKTWQSPFDTNFDLDLVFSADT